MRDAGEYVPFVLTPPRHMKKAIFAFSLVEVTLALGIISVSLLSLIGLLPAGLGVLRESMDQNRACADRPADRRGARHVGVHFADGTDARVRSGRPVAYGYDGCGSALHRDDRGIKTLSAGRERRRRYPADAGPSQAHPDRYHAKQCAQCSSRLVCDTSGCTLIAGLIFALDHAA